MSIIIVPSSLEAQRQANASASITVTVLPAVGVEVRERVSLQSENGNIKSEFFVKVNDTGKYSLRIFNEANTTSTVAKVLEANSTYHIQERELGPKKIVQVALLSS